MTSNYCFNYIKELFYNNSYIVNYNIAQIKGNVISDSFQTVNYFNIILEIKDKWDNIVFYTDENWVDLKIGEEKVCKKCLDILIGDYDIFGEEFCVNHMKNIKMNCLQTDLENLII